MSEIENLISEFNDMCGEPETEIGNLARNEFYLLRKCVAVCREILEAHDKGLTLARDAIIGGSLQRVISQLDNQYAKI